MPERADVVVVGAGLAGLRAAGLLQAAGLETLVLEQHEQVGGRVRTDRADRLLIDHGFQVFNPAYPEARSALDLDALQLGAFRAGLAIRVGTHTHIMADPRREPSRLIAAALGPGSLAGKAAALRLLLRAGNGKVEALLRDPDVSFADALRSSRLSDDKDALVRALQQFLSGVIGRADLDVSNRMATMLLRSFVRGTPSLPGRGMQAIPEQLAARLHDGSVRLGVRVSAVSGTTVRTDAGAISTRAVVVATDPRSAGDLSASTVPEMSALTTYFHLVSAELADPAYLRVDADRRGPVVNSAALSAAAPQYASRPGTLLASTVLGVAGAEGEPAARAHAAQIWNVPQSAFELVATHAIRDALPRHLPGQPLKQEVRLGDGVYVAGDHRDTPSIQGALVSGRRVADSVLADLRAAVAP